VIALLRKIERCLQFRDEVHQRRVNGADAAGERAFERVERRPRLERRHGVDQVRDGFRLDEIDSSVQIRAEREFTWIRESPAGGNHGADDRLEDDRAAVRGNFGDVFAGVGMRRWKDGDDRAIDRNAVTRCDIDERRMPRGEPIS
jgi:hypothetical protein